MKLMFPPLRQLLTRSNGVAMPSSVQMVLQSQYNLDREAMRSLRCKERDGNFAGRPVRYIRIYDPSQYTGRGKRIRGYHDLDRNKEGILFEGYVDKKGYVYISDRRPGNGSIGPGEVASPS
jgi:hypothetical protein